MTSRFTGNIVDDRPRHAGLGRRFLALVFDFCLTVFPVTRAVRGVWMMRQSDHLWGYGWIVTNPLYLGFLVDIFLCFVLVEDSLGDTPGKRLMNLRVVNTTGVNPGFIGAVARSLLRNVDCLPSLNNLGEILILTSSDQTRFCDRVAGTGVMIRN